MAQMDAQDRPAPFVEKLSLRDYKSIPNCSVALSHFTALIGPNGAGKSNVLDSLRFVADSLQTSLDSAITKRGGFSGIVRRSFPSVPSFGIALELNLPTGRRAGFRVEVQAAGRHAFAVKEEECWVADEARYLIRDCVFQGQRPEELQAAVEPDRLYLNAVSGVRPFRQVYDALRGMAFYNFEPARARQVQDLVSMQPLAPDGWNVAAVLRRLKDQHEAGGPDVLERIMQFLEVITPGLQSIGVRRESERSGVLTFAQEILAQGEMPSEPLDRVLPETFDAMSMSEGTLRALVALVAAFQESPEPSRSIPVVGIEEPECALHPAAVHTLTDAFLEASWRRQILVTSHSPDLLDHEELMADNIVAVASAGGRSVVAPINAGSRKTLRERLFTAGELLRMQQLDPDIPLAELGTQSAPPLGDGEKGTG